MRRKEAKDLLQRAKDRFKVMYEADELMRRAANEDLKFVNVPGEQWDHNMKQERGKRPCYEFNKIRISGKRIINDMRANRPQGKIRAVEGGDVEQAEIREGLVRNIWNTSDADTVIDYAAEYQVNAGMTAWRVDTEYSDDTAFEQDICIRAIPNPFTVYVDPACKDLMKRDAMDWLVTEKISIEEYEDRWPKAEKSDFEDAREFDDEGDWQEDNYVRVAEYWYKEPIKKEIWKVDFGDGDIKVVDSESDEAAGIDQAMIVQRREVMTYRIMYCTLSGDRILDKPQRWAGHQFPFVMIYGEFVVVDGRTYWWGLPRFAKDAQRSYNVARTAISETIAMAPQSKWWSTPKQAEGLTDQWSVAHKQNLPFMLYNPDEKAPGEPKRMGGADVPIALIQESQIASDEIKAVTGIYDASLGNRSNEQSGRAIYARQQQGEIATFNYQDNMAKGIKRTYEIILDLLPEIYDTERDMRILGTDGAEDYVKVNQVVFDPATGKSITVNDMAAGRYDVTVTIGPNFSTLRQEAAETYSMMAQQFPELMGIAGDLVMKSMDLPYADDIADRLKTLLPPQIQQQMNQGKEIPPEVQQIMQQAEQAMQQVQEHGQLVQAAAAELEQEKSLNEKQKAEIRTELANVRAAKAEFDAHIAQQLAGLSEKETGLVMRDANLQKTGAELTKRAAEQAVGEVSGAIDVASSREVVENIDNVLASFMEAIDSAMTGLNQKAAILERKADRRPVGGVTRREGGRLVADVQFDDGSTRSISAVKENGGLRIVGPDSEG